MRCPSCGTENAPDSRFCGGCGGKLTPPAVSKPPLAPTAKIPDDAPFPAPTGQRPQIQQGYQQGPPSIPPGDPYAATGPASIPPTRGPTSIPPHASYQRAPTPAPVGASLSSRPTPLAPELRPASQGRGDEPAFASMPPTQQRKPVARPTPVPAGSMAGDSFVVPPQRPLGLIAIVLVIDFALAGAGAVMLSKGLAKKTPEEAGPPKAPQQKMEQRTEVTPPPAPTPTPAPSASPSEAVAAAAPTPVVEARPDTKLPAAAGSLVEAKPDKNPTRGKDKDTKKKGGATTSTGATTAPKGGGATSSGPVTHPGGGTTPEDPYKDPPKDPPAPSGFDLKAESNKLASSSGDLFARCLAAAGTVHGTIKVAYRVQPSGSVDHPFAVENSTGNEQLGVCLSDVIATWRYSPHTGDVQNAVRPFNYP